MKAVSILLLSILYSISAFGADADPFESCVFTIKKTTNAKSEIVSDHLKFFGIVGSTKIYRSTIGPMTMQIAQAQGQIVDLGPYDLDEAEARKTNVNSLFIVQVGSPREPIKRYKVDSDSLASGYWSTTDVQDELQLFRALLRDGSPLVRFGHSIKWESSIMVDGTEFTLACGHEG